MFFKIVPDCVATQFRLQKILGRKLHMREINNSNNADSDWTVYSWSHFISAITISTVTIASQKV